MAKRRSDVAKSREARGLYFPYANINSLRSFKTAVLYFDRISIIDPQANFCGHPGSSPDLRRESHAYESQMSVLVHEGIVDLVDPARVVERFGNEIMTGVIEDMNDASFRDLCKAFSHSSWILSCAKLPTAADKWLRNMLVNVPALGRDIAVPGHFEEHRSEFHESRVPFDEMMMHRMREHPYFEEVRPGRYQKEDEAQLQRGLMFDEYRIVELPFFLGESIMIGNAIAACATENLTPFCDENIHFNALKTRLRRGTDSRALKSILREYGYLRDVKTDLMALDVISETVPNLESVPLDMILDFRRKRTQELRDFRLEMSSLQVDIESTPWDTDFQKHVFNTIDSKVKPAMKRVENEICGCRDAFWAGAVDKIAKVSPLPIVGSIFTGVPALVAVALGAAVAGLSLILDQSVKMKNVKRNGWALLFDAGQLPAQRRRSK